MVVTVTLHMIRVFYHGAYKPPREFNWVVGVVLFLTTLLLSFTGYLLPWDQIGYWAITVGSNMASYAPLLGAQAHNVADRPAGGCGSADTHSFLYPARHWAAAGWRGVDGCPLLAHPQGWRRSWPAAAIEARDRGRARREAAQRAGSLTVVSQRLAVRQAAMLRRWTTDGNEPSRRNRRDAEAVSHAGGGQAGGGHPG